MTLTEVFDTIALVGKAAGCPERAAVYIKHLEGRVSRVSEATAMLREDEKPSVGFLEWIDPPFNAGHWTPEIIELAGGIDSFGTKHQPSRTISDEVLIEADPDVLIIALCGFNEQRAAEDMEILANRIDLKRLKAHQKGQIHVLDGNSLFSRPGPRLVDSLGVLVDILHPGLMKSPNGGPVAV
ncbi:MAG TPA: hypothetical protein EYQ00_02870 [Dehalococcoidia bacterium]|nr:hypothetical protein [Dehalococcoidia bacterium]